MLIGLHVKYPLFLSDFNETRIFSTDYRKIQKIPNFMKICYVRAKLYHTSGQADGRTNMTKLTVASRNFTNALKITDLHQMKYGYFVNMLI